MASEREREFHLQIYPQYKKAYLRAFEIMLKAKGNDVETPEQFMHWWIYGQEKIPEGQFSIFD
jgi:hypothetical protein